MMDNTKGQLTPACEDKLEEHIGTFPALPPFSKVDLKLTIRLTAVEA